MLRLAADDSALSASETVTITVNLPVNAPPVVDAGPNQSITLPSNATLNGTVTDDGFPDPPGAVTTRWLKRSGPSGTVGFVDSRAVDTVALFPRAGSYVLRLIADDGALSASDEVTITVAAAPNQPPVVNAGPNQIITPPSNAILNGTVSDDGLPDPPGVVTTVWSKQSGPGTVGFTDSNAIDTTAVFSESGIYALRLTADDGALSAFDELVITVETLPHQRPVVDAGPDQIITLPVDTVALDGTATDDDLPDPPGVITTAWSKQSGPGTVGFTDSSAMNTTAVFSESGTYVLRLTADDSELSGFDELTVVVNQRPAVYAGLDQTTLDHTVTTIVLSGNVTDDGLPSPPGVTTTVWTTTGAGVFADANALNTTVTYPGSGTYIVTLTADDGIATAQDSLTVIVTAAANSPPVVNAGPDQSTDNLMITLLGTATDDGNPDPPGVTTTVWTTTGDGVIADPSSLSTTVVYPEPGVYTVTLTADDSELSVQNSLTVVISREEEQALDLREALYVKIGDRRYALDVEKDAAHPS